MARSAQLFIFLLCLTSTRIFSQAEPQVENSPESRRELSFAYGQAYHLKLDHTYSRLPKRGFTNSFALGFNNLNPKRTFGGQLNFINGQLGTHGNQVNLLTNYAGGLQLWYLKKMKSLKTFDFYLGLNLGLRGEIWFPPAGLLRYGWDISSGLGSSFSIHSKIKPKLALRYRFDLQLLGVLWRSHNNGQQLTSEKIQLEQGFVATAFENAHFAQPFNSFYLDHSFLLSYEIGVRWTLCYRFALSYKHLKPPLLKKGYQLDNMIGLAFQF